MTIQQLIESSESYSVYVLFALLSVPLFCFFLSLVLSSDRAKGAPWKYLYSLLVYLACIPGIGAAVLTAYTVFLLRHNMLEMNVIIYVVPIITMGAALFFIRRRIEFDAIPGFERLSGLMILLGVSFGIVLAIEKTHIGIWFIGSFARLTALLVGVFALLKWGSGAVMRGSNDTKKPFPKLFKS